MMMNKRELSLYIHIPFCEEKCSYCNFVSITDKNIISEYIDYLIKEIDLYNVEIKNSIIKTIYIGGGTPSFISEKHIESLVKAIKKYNNLEKLEEFTIEVNPSSVNLKKLKVYKALGINRISMGLQSTNNKLLKILGRRHNFTEAKESYDLIRRAGFENVSLDLIFGIPGQSLQDLKASVDALIAWEPEHISAYSLKIEPDTPMGALKQQGLIQEVEESLDRKMYHMLIRELEAYGYYFYEISNFSKEGYASKHNLVYWTREPYLGLGVSAHGFIHEKRYGNVNTFKSYFDMINAHEKPITSLEAIDAKEALFEEIMLGLRLRKGLLIDYLNKKYQIDFLKRFDEVIHKLEKDHLIVVDEGTVALTLKGFDISNFVIGEFMV